MRSSATGNLLSMYRKAGAGSLKQTELNIYGSSMLGKTGEQAVTPVQPTQTFYNNLSGYPAGGFKGTML